MLDTREARVLPYGMPSGVEIFGVNVLRMYRQESMLHNRVHTDLETLLPQEVVAWLQIGWKAGVLKLDQIRTDQDLFTKGSATDQRYPQVILRRTVLRGPKFQAPEHHPTAQRCRFVYIKAPLEEWQEAILWMLAGEYGGE